MKRVFQLEKAIVKWSEQPKLQEIQKFRKENKHFSKKKFTEYLMSGSGHIEKHTEQIKPDYYPGYKPYQKD